MQNRFGLKDLVTLVLLLAIGVTVWLSMKQRDREWDQVQAVKAKLGDLERQLSRIEAGIENGVVMAGPAPTGAAPEAEPADVSWARPDSPIEWQEPWGYATDPRSAPDFRIGGEFTESFEVQPAKLTPYVQTDVYGRRVLDLVSEGLGAYDPKTLKLRGVLADAWQADPAGLWLRVHINPRARFSDGQPVTAEDVRWTFHDFVMNLQVEAERTRSIVADVIDRVEVIDKHTVEFIFKDAFFSNLDSALTLFILPKHVYSQLSPAQINQGTGLLVGSGPFKLESFDVDRQWAPPEPVVLVRNEQYWGPKAPIERMRFTSISDERARLAAYKTGEATMITPSGPQFVAAPKAPDWAEHNRDLKWVNMKSGRGGIIWNCAERNGKPTPFRDKRVRQAMTMLLDREKIVRDIYDDTRMVAKGFFNPGTPGDDPDLQPWPYDQSRARELLAEAGWADRDGNRVLEDERGNEFVFELTYFGGGEIAERLVLFVKDSYAAAGIRCNLRQMDWSVGEPVRNRRDFDAMVMGWGANAPESDPKQIFHSESIKDQGDNFAQWNSPEADRVIDEARKELDADKRAVLWRELDRVMHDEQPYTWLSVQPWLRFIKSDVGNVNTYPKGLELWEFFRGGGDEPMPVQ
jgi:peptide/nickel transport system substrate-binding protein